MTEPPAVHWFEPLAEHMGPAYLRYSFTKGTEQEITALIEALGLEPGMRVLDVGCGPGRHSLELARRGFRVTGVDISSTFVDLARAGAPAGASFEVGDARRLAYRAEFDAAISLCQGGFGLCGGPAGTPGTEPDGQILGGMVRALVPGGRFAVSAFSAYFRVRWLGDTDRFDADTGVNAEETEVRDPEGNARPATLWTTCFTPRELRLLTASVGAITDAIWAVTPGDYRPRPPGIEHPEFLLLGHVKRR